MQLLRNVSLSIKEIRQIGKNHINIYHPNSEFEGDQKKNIYWINRLQVLLNSDNFIPFYQPIKNIQTDKITKHECLARIKDNNELITPNIFIEPAKHIELIIKIVDLSENYLNAVSGELEQVLINLINNGKDALIQNNLEDPFIQLEYFTDEHYLYITVLDNAGGINHKIKNKIFQEYFTTKNDQGTGLGLYMSKNIIEKSFAGNLSFENVQNGAMFIVKIPKQNQ